MDKTEKPIVGPEGPYRCIYLDPPWPEHGGGKSKRGADRHYPLMSVEQIADVAYQALTLEQGAWADFNHIAADAHCWVWVTDNYLEDGLYLMRRMGFKYKRTLVWAKTSPGNIEAKAREAAECILDCFSADRVKDRREAADYLNVFIGETLNAPKGGVLRTGLGQYARGSHELLLFGTRGKAHMPPTDARPKSVQFAPVGRHSEKPELFAEIIERCSPGPRLEMFARRRREGWAAFGNEVQ